MWSSKNNGAIIYWLSSYINKALVSVDLFLLPEDTTGSCSAFCLPTPPGPFQNSCCPTWIFLNFPPAWISARSWSTSDAGLSFCPCWISWGLWMQRSSWRAALPPSILIVPQPALRCKSIEQPSLRHFLQVIVNDVEQDMFPNWPLWWSTCCSCYCPHGPLTIALLAWPSNPSSCLLIQTEAHELR